MSNPEITHDDDESIVIIPSTRRSGMSVDIGQIVDESVQRRIDLTFAPLPSRPSFLGWLIS